MSVSLDQDVNLYVAAVVVVDQHNLSDNPRNIDALIVIHIVESPASESSILSHKACATAKYN